MSQQQNDVQNEIEELRQEIDTLRARILQLEGEADTDDLPDGAADQFDAAVIDALEPGERVTLTQLRNLYRESGIMNDGVLKQRVREITNMEYFEQTGMQHWRFKRPGGGE